MSKRPDHVALLVPDHDDAMAFFLRIGFERREDTDLNRVLSAMRAVCCGVDDRPTVNSFWME
ncbi:MAG: hypothetical protein ACK4L4_17755 [Gemmobacter sp.]